MAEMDMKEKLVELLGADVCKHDSCDNCECQGSTDMCIATLKAYMADHLIQNGVTFATDNNVGSKWIPVTERVPDNGEIVLACGKRHATSGMFQGALRNNPKLWHWKGNTLKEVTHWMPLPEPPKGE